MRQRLNWGGIRGKGLRLTGDIGMSIAALGMATIVVIAAYYVFERSAVKAYVEKSIPIAESADKVVERADKLWDADLLTKTPDPLTNEIDPIEMRNQATIWKFQLEQDAKKVSTAQADYAKLTSAPNAATELYSEIGSYLRATDTYMKDARAIVFYMDELILIEMNMNDAIRSVPYSQGYINPGALRQRDVVLAAELDRIKKLNPPKTLQNFHDDTVQFLSEYVIIQQQTTSAYETAAGLAVLEALGDEGEILIREAREKLRADVRTLKTGQLGRDSQKSRAHKKDTRDEIARLRDAYRF